MSLLKRSIQWMAEFGLQEQVFAVIYTFGKAVGFHGAAIAGSSILRDYLINFCRPFIYTTAPSPQIIAETKIAYDRLKQADEPRQNLTKVLEYFEICCESYSKPYGCKGPRTYKI